MTEKGFKKFLEEEKNKLKQMKSFKDRFDYIWEYYKLHIVGTIFIIIVASYIINLTLINPPKRREVGLTITSEALPNEEIFKANAEKAINVQEGYEIVITNLYLGATQNSAYQNAVKQKFMVMLAANEIDLIIGVKDFFDDLNSTQAMFGNLEQILSSTKYDGIRDKFIENLIPIEAVESGVDDSEIIDYTNPVDQKIYKCVSKPIAVSLEGNEVLEQLGYNTENLYIGFISNSKRMDKALDLFDYIMGLMN